MSTVFEQVKEKTDLVELIGKSVQLKRVGSNYRSLCPFHEEKTASFYVRPETQRFHCYGCSARGDCFDWMVEHEHLTPREALRTLAATAGVNVDDDDRHENDQRILGILNIAQGFYEHRLRDEDALHARRYLRDRGILDETCVSFGLGYAPGHRSLSKFLKDKGFDTKAVLESGLVVQSDKMLARDLLDERIVFPIRDASGRVVGFGGRSLDSNARSKYINTRESSVFHKHSVLYGFDQARSMIADKRQVVVVEGYMDVLQAHQKGFRNVVATLGTSITDSHVRQLANVADDIVLALDPDKSGQSATWRALQRAEETLRRGVTSRRRAPEHVSQVRIVKLPDGMDPDDCIRESPNLWSLLVDKAKPVVDFAMSHVQNTCDFSNPESSAAAADQIADTLVWVSNPVARAQYIQKAAELLDVDESDVRELVRRRGYISGSRLEPVRIDGQSEWDEYALALRVCGIVPTGFPFEFANQESRALASWIDQREIGEAPPPELKELANRVSKRLPGLSDLLPHQQAHEMLRTQHALARQTLFATRSEVLSLLATTDDTTERATLAERYSSVTRAIRASDAQIVC